MANSIVSSVTHIANQYAASSVVTMAAGATLALVVTEMGVRALKDGYQMATTVEGEARGKAWENLGANLGGCLFYGMLAANVIPGSPIVGLAIFSLYSASKNDAEENYLSTKVIKKIADPAWEFVAKAITKICSFAWDILKLFGNTVRGIVAAIPLPQHPVWYGVAAVAIGIFIANR